MKIETKYDPGDRVWVMHLNKPKEIELIDVKIECYKKGTNANDLYATYTIYYIPFGLIGIKYGVNEVFDSKQDLINSL